jgi:hypothetical protein
MDEEVAPCAYWHQLFQDGLKVDSGFAKMAIKLPPE